MKFKSMSMAVAAVLLALSGCSPTMTSSEAPDAEETISENGSTEAQETDTAEEQSEESAILSEGTFKMAVFNYDDESYPDLEVWVRGIGSWYPDAESGDTKSEFGPFPVGEILEGDFYVYPFGRDGIEVPVTINLKDDHISESDRDQIWIWIEDGVLTVTGTPLLQDIEIPIR